MSDNFSFRWGVDLLDGGFTQIPNLFFDWYHKVVSYKEFALILHLARYQYERAGSQARPSLQTIAEQMGISDKAVRRSVRDLEKRKLLTIERPPGKPSIYNFGGFSKAVLSHAWAQETLDKNGSTPKNGSTSTPKNGRGVLPKMTTEEEQEEIKNNDIVDLLLSFGVEAITAKRLAKTSALETVTAWIEYAKTNNLGAGFVVSRLKSGEKPPTVKIELSQDEKIARDAARYGFMT